MQQAISVRTEPGLAAGSSERAEPEHLLVLAVAAGRGEALTELYARVGKALFAFLYRRLDNDALWAEEVLQDVMVAVWRGAAGFRGDSRAMTWLFGIAHRKAVQARRRKSVERHLGLLDLDSRAARNALGTTGGTEAVDQAADHGALHRAVAALPEDMRQCLELTLIQGFSCQEAAEILGVAAGTVKSRLFRGRAQLRAALETPT